MKSVIAQLIRDAQYCRCRVSCGTKRGEDPVVMVPAELTSSAD